MPFDDTSIRSEIDIPPKIVKNTLAAIGITPVPREVAAAHKAKMLAAFAAESEYNAHLVWSDVARWATTARRRYSRKSLPARLMQQGIDYWTNDPSAAPQEIIDIAKIVRKEISGAEFAIEWFYIDPILNVYYTGHDGVHHNDCLGIWLNGQTVEIATVGKMRKKWLRWLLG